MGGKRILVVGAGFAGVYAAMGMRELARRGHRITVVNPESFMQYQPFLPEVASGTIDPRAVVVPLRPLLRHCDLVVGDAGEIDLGARAATVRTAGGPHRIAFDVLVLAPGSTSRVLPIPGLAEHGVGFKTVQEAIYLRNRVLSCLDLAAATDDPERRQAALTFVFVGGGYAGVEALGELEDLARAAIRTYPSLRGESMRWMLVDAAPSILPELTSGLAAYAVERLEERGVEVVLGTKLESYEDRVVRLSDGRAFPAETLVWTAGVRPSPLGRSIGLPVEPDGRVRTDRFLRVEGIEGVWAAGDVAAVPDPGGGFMPPTAQHGMRQGRHLGRNVLASLLGERLEPFTYRSLGAVCSLGRYKGIAVVGRLRLRGFPAWFLHRTYHLYAMPTLTRKAKIAADWTVALLFPRDLAQLGSLEHPREPFERAAGSGGER
jgi:NADH dehydrogenase